MKKTFPFFLFIFLLPFNWAFSQSLQNVSADSLYNLSKEKNVEFPIQTNTLSLVLNWNLEL